MAQSPTFASRLKRKLLSGPILGGAYNMSFGESINKTEYLDLLKIFEMTIAY
jgi:hypothetical protein